jgi:hypothetical protein
MSETVTDDTVPTVTGTLARAGGTRRRELRLPSAAADDFPAGEVVRVVVDGSEYHAQLQRNTDGAPVIRGAYATPSLARDPGNATDAFTAWVDEHDLEAGRSVHVDVVEPGFKYGFRAPGESATYEAHEPPSSSLADIAKSLEES